MVWVQVVWMGVVWENEHVWYAAVHRHVKTVVAYGCHKTHVPCISLPLSTVHTRGCLCSKLGCQLQNLLLNLVRVGGREGGREGGKKGRRKIGRDDYGRDV